MIFHRRLLRLQYPFDKILAFNRLTNSNSNTLSIPSLRMFFLKSFKVEWLLSHKYLRPNINHEREKYKKCGLNCMWWSGKSLSLVLVLTLIRVHIFYSNWHFLALFPPSNNVDPALFYYLFYEPYFKHIIWFESFICGQKNKPKL